MREQYVLHDEYYSGTLLTPVSEKGKLFKQGSCEQDSNANLER
jgi:hypothetical protein